MTTATASCQARRRRRASERDSQISPMPKASVRTRAASGQPGGSTPRTMSDPVRHLRRQRRGDPITPTSAAPRRAGTRRLGFRSLTRPGYNVLMRDSERRRPDRIRLPRWVTLLLGARRGRPRSVDALSDVHAALAPRDPPLRPRLGRLRHRARRRLRGDRVGRVRGSHWLVPFAAVDRDDARLRRLVRRRHLADRRRDLGGGRRGVLRRAAARGRVRVDRLRRRDASSPRRSTASRRPTPAAASCGASSNVSRCSSCATRSSSSSSSSRVTRFSSSRAPRSAPSALLARAAPGAAHAAGSSAISSSTVSRISGCYRARPCGLERRRWRRFSRRACAAGSDGVAVDDVDELRRRLRGERLLRLRERDRARDDGGPHGRACRRPLPSSHSGRRAACAARTPARAPSRS